MLSKRNNGGNTRIPRKLKKSLKARCKGMKSKDVKVISCNYGFKFGYVITQKLPF